MYKHLIAAAFLLSSLCAVSQPKPEIPLMRKLFHDNIDKAQKSIDKLDKKEDKQFRISTNEEVNQQVTYSLFDKVDQMQTAFELDSTLDANDKIKYLRGVNEALTLFESKYLSKEMVGAQLPDVINAFEEAMYLERKKRSIESVVRNNELEVGEIILQCFPFKNSKGTEASRDLLVLKACQRNPEKVLPILKANPNVSFADSLIKLVARSRQEELYTYAQSVNSPIGRRIQKVDDPLVNIIRTLANMNTGRLYFPFLDKLYSGKLSIEEIGKTLDDEYAYYRLLVNTQIDYAGRLRLRDTPMVHTALTSMLRKKSIDNFINVINGLHEENDVVRMKKVEPLNPQELYYMCIMGETEIYTSSYLKSYDRIWQRMKNPNSDSLLLSVNFDHFKKFIKMAANYNTLDDFLKRMDKTNAETVMKAFVNNLEKTGDLEDAVDVADSYGSIYEKNLRKLMLTEIANSYQNMVKTGNKRGAVIYNLLQNIFMSMDSTNKIDLGELFGVPPIYSVSSKSLQDSSGRIIIQQFFYGDKDGNTVFNNFVGAYSNANWKIVRKPEWIEVMSTRGTPITIYANRPLDETQGLDAKAQANLEDYLVKNDINPTMVIHRGHSYYVGSTIDQLAPSAKIVLLGSCGGYHNLSKVLNVCPYAHIIASKQVGSGTVNQPMIISLTEILRQGKDLEWTNIWKDFGKRFASNPLFDDYVPPYNNLGAIFIMAYNKMIDQNQI